MLVRERLCRPLLLVVLVVVACIPLLPAAAKSANARQGKIDSSLALAYSFYKQRPEDIPDDLRRLADEQGIAGIITSRRPLNSSEDKLLKGLGVHLRRNSHLSGGGHSHIPWQSIDKLADLDFVDFISSDWSPSVVSCLDVSAQQTGAKTVWSTLDQVGSLITGQGIIVASFDTGVDVYHPGLWKPDGPVRDWIDVNSNGVFDNGIDTVDMNGSGSADPGELLNYSKGSALNWLGQVSNASGPYVAAQDWLYNDANANGVRDYGLSFGEAAPTYGERIYLLQDSNGNGSIDVGEKLVELKTSKVLATLGSGGVTRTRGVNLISTPADTLGHGTSVCGIICGETPAMRKYVGIAPGAELLVADRYANSYTNYIPWAEQRGAKVMIYEFGAWTFQFMDGSSTLEQMITAEAAKGIVQITPAGNLANVKKHTSVSVGPGATKDLTMNVPSGRGITAVYASVIWTRQSSQVAFKLTNPAGATYDLFGDSTFRTDPSGNSYWSNGILESSRHTKRYDITISRSSGVTTGNWKIVITNNSSSAIQFNGFVSDNLAVWSGGTVFSGNISTAKTVTWPATADKTLSAGSFSTRGVTVPVGARSAYSSIGPMISSTDQAVDLCAPGNSDVFTLASKDALNPIGSYIAFGGTSAGAAHLAGAAALLLQANPNLTAYEVSELISGCASTDTYTGDVPNESWGYGKLNILPAVENAISPALDPLAAIKGGNSDGNVVRTWGKIVIAVGNDGSPYFYIEEAGRTSGLKVVGGPWPVVEGDKVEVTGILSTVNGERQINASNVKIVVQRQAVPLPLGISAHLLVGGNSNGSPGLSQAVGLNNVGLLVTSWGEVTSLEPDKFYMRIEPSFEVGVALGGLTPPVVGNFVSVTGVSSVEMRDGTPQRLLRPRRQSDIIILR
ncbi:MAG: S8 family serine peptidase [Armatimonadota bacterium]|nr:S8 family serine peptidase [Armatimonadota bacterium]